MIDTMAFPSLSWDVTFVDKSELSSEKQKESRVKIRCRHPNNVPQYSVDHMLIPTVSGAKVNTNINLIFANVNTKESPVFVKPFLPLHILWFHSPDLLHESTLHPFHSSGGQRHVPSDADRHPVCHQLHHLQNKCLRLLRLHPDCSVHH